MTFHRKTLQKFKNIECRLKKNWKRMLMLLFLLNYIIFWNIQNVDLNDEQSDQRITTRLGMRPEIPAFVFFNIFWRKEEDAYLIFI